MHLSWHHDVNQVDRGYARLEMLKEGHEAEMEPLTRDIDRLQVARINTGYWYPP